VTEDPADIAHADQTAAHLRGFFTAFTASGEKAEIGTVMLDRAELEALAESGATPEQVRAWMQEQINKDMAARDLLADLNPTQEDDQ
jgi:hypothetical protein